ncbi:MAG: hypothetical protein AAF549_00175 [Pseudomonadota bacterium]
MFNKLGKCDSDRLREYLIVPLAISDILFHDLEVEPDMQYGLHHALSEIDPDSALLAIALSAYDIAERNSLYVPIASALQKEASNIIEEYGPIWLRHFKDGPMPPEIYNSVLQTVPEDLEALADLMDALSADLECVNEATPLLCNLLSVQARAHIQIADFVLEELAKDTSQPNISRDVPTPSETFEIQEKQTYKDNIIIFPGSKTS